MSSNIVTVAPGKNNKTTTRPLFQWDYGQILQLQGFENLPDQYVMHFSNENFAGEATEMIGDASGVDIPDALLQTGKPVYAWLYLHTGNADGETVYQITIPVTPRPQPTDGGATPQQVDAVDRAIQALNGAVDDAQAAQAAAEAAAQEAQGYAGYYPDLAARMTTAEGEIEEVQETLYGHATYKHETSWFLSHDAMDWRYLSRYNAPYVGKNVNTDFIVWSQDQWYDDQGHELPHKLGHITLSLSGARYIRFPALGSSSSAMDLIVMDSTGLIIQEYQSTDKAVREMVTIELLTGATRAYLSFNRDTTMRDDLYLTLLSSSGLVERKDYVPAGGTTGQILTKQSDTDFDATWDDADSTGVYNFTAEIYSNTLLSDARAADIITAYDAGQDIRGRLLVDGKYYELYLSGVYTQDSNRWIFLSSIVEYSNFTERYEVVAKEGNTYLTWFKHDIPGAVTPLVQFAVTLTYSNGTLTSDRTVREIWAASNRNEQIIARLTIGSYETVILPFLSVYFNQAQNSFKVKFGVMLPYSSSLAYWYGAEGVAGSTINDPDTWTYIRNSIAWSAV